MLQHSHFSACTNLIVKRVKLKQISVHCGQFVVVNIQFALFQLQLTNSGEGAQGRILTPHR